MAGDVEQFEIVQHLPLTYPHLSVYERIAFDQFARRRLRAEAAEQGFEVLAMPEVEAIIPMVHIYDPESGEYVPKPCGEIRHVVGCDYVERRWRAPVRRRQRGSAA